MPSSVSWECTPWLRWLPVKREPLQIVDGSSLGQVASQTLPNLLATRMNVEMPVLSPLIGMDKVEIEDLARKIGTYDISIIPDGGCSAVPAQPSTAADPQRVLDAARDIDLKNEIIRVLESGSERIM